MIWQKRGVPHQSRSNLEEVIRSELFSPERFDEHARGLALAQKVTANPSHGIRIFPHLRKNAKRLRSAYLYISEALHAEEAIAPAAEWLIDSFYVIDEQLREIHNGLPRQYYDELPKIAEGFLTGYPRVYGICWAYVAHSDSRFDPASLERFVRTYQEVQPLTMGEVWAISVTLRIVMIENLRRIADRVVASQEARRYADRLADEFLGLRSDRKKVRRIELDSFHRLSDGDAFLVQLVQRFRYQDPDTTPALAWLHSELAKRNTDADAIASNVHQAMAATNATVRNIITSFRSMSNYSWLDFFENTSVVHLALKSVAGFTDMDFKTRDRYRHAIEDIAYATKKDEMDITRAVIQSSKESSATLEGDIGYFLIGLGREKFEHDQGARTPIQNLFLKWYYRHIRLTYFGTLLAGAAAVLAVPLYYFAPDSLFAVFVVGFFGLFSATEIAFSIVNRLIAEYFGPERLPRMKLQDGPPAHARTFVVVPTLLIDPAEVAAQFERLEVHYLANPEGDTLFALLTDWADSKVEYDLATDAAILEEAHKSVALLNQRHAPCSDGSPRFFVFHRKRQWNPSQGTWMGWERKRGKLQEFNRLLRGHTTTSFLPVTDPKNQPPKNVRYVLTLDADTRLPKGTVSQLVGIFCHPLNRPVFDPETGRIRQGYGILQPRITASLPGLEDRTIFQKLFSGECGVDPYASAISDVYQDLFREGSFTGKGIYDVDAFEMALEGRIRENTLLSHDLFEGTFARCGFVSDVELYEDFPSHHAVSDARTHRWTRGDWQLLPWIIKSSSASLPALSRWKMFDNLRRSLTMPAILSLILFACFSPDVQYLPWILFALAGFGFPPFIPFIADCLPRRNRTIRDHLHELKRTFGLGLGHFGVGLVLLAHQAVHQLDAVIRVLWRLGFSRKNLLEWTTAAQAKRSATYRLMDSIYRMRTSMLLGATLIGAAYQADGAVSPMAFYFGVLWMIAPIFALWISSPAKESERRDLDPDEIPELRTYARRIWRFFTTFVTAEDHFLPPDNFQEDPAALIAHRSSPTNFGLYLLSVVTARDFGWSGVRETATRLEQTLKTMEGLPRFRGHFYNWYEIRDLRLLDPKYISSVDSGNLAGHLIAVAQACDEMRRKPVASGSSVLGIQDAIHLLCEEIVCIEDSLEFSGIRFTSVLPQVRRFEEHLHRAQTDAEILDFWSSLEHAALVLKKSVAIFASEAEVGGVSPSELLAWLDQLCDNVNSHASDVRALIPWVPFVSGVGAIAGRAENQRDLWNSLLHSLDPNSAMGTLPEQSEAALFNLEQLRRSSKSALSPSEELFLDQLQDALMLSVVSTKEILKRYSALSRTAHKLFSEMEFGFLFNTKKKLFSIGYRVDSDQLDESCYDLLASEARLTSYVAIIKGDVPVSHWFRLGRGLTPVSGGAALISWSGSMFEYLMPSLVMSEPADSLLDRTCSLIVEKQIKYGQERRVPWGISESAFNVRDLEMNYQYSNFGVPGLGLKRGLSNDLVIAPYATALASMRHPKEAIKNFEAIAALGGSGRYGFYEALDFTPSRLREGQKTAVIRSYMAHHQGMTLVALSNLILGSLIPKRFHAEPLVQSAELLLQERTPRQLGNVRHSMGDPETVTVRNIAEPVSRKLRSPHHLLPTSHLLSNGKYGVMITAAGSGYSRWKNIVLTRWRNDVTQDNRGQYIYLKNLSSGQVWSPSFHPLGVDPERSDIVFTEQEAKISRVDGEISTELRVIVSVEDDVELRQLSITNHGRNILEIEVTSYCEVVLAPFDADRAHPAFSNLFMQTEFAPEISGLIASRRPRSEKEALVFLAQTLTTTAKQISEMEYETDRSRFLGRNKSTRYPEAIKNKFLSLRTGAVLDPILSMRIRIRIEPGETERIFLSTLVATSRDELLRLAEKNNSRHAFERASILVWTHAHARLRHLGIEPDEAQVFQKLANQIIFSDPLMRPSSEYLKQNTLNVTGLWGRGISGDYPIVLVRIEGDDELFLIRQLLRAHEYWRMKCLSVDIVILNEKASSYVQDFQLGLESLSRGSEATLPAAADFYPGKVFVLRNDLLDTRERILLQTIARVILNGRQGSLAEQVLLTKVPKKMRTIPPKFIPEVIKEVDLKNEVTDIVAGLEMFNGLGGFSSDGQEYVIVLTENQVTPAPWINVISNAQFGFQTSESGSGYTWSVNSRENQLTAWSNDPVVDPPSEAFYIRDLESGKFWSPTASPIRHAAGTYVIRHGKGYSSFDYEANGIKSELTQFLGGEDSIKISKLVLTNTSDTSRSLSVTGYVEWVLGFSRDKTAPYVITEIDPETHAIFAKNPMDAEFGHRIAFFGMLESADTFTADRGEFIGRNGTLGQPVAFYSESPLRGSVGAALDPCGVLQKDFQIAPNESITITYFLGQSDTSESARDLILKYRRTDLNQVFAETERKWKRILGGVQVRTPDRAMDLLLNGWLIYQTVACRFWARAAFYQVGGAIGFRDQLQDTMAFVAADPTLARAHILNVASRQFIEGDVQHWWHPPTGRGVRTHFSDDLLWLPYVLLHYLKVTEDFSILDVSVSFIEGPQLRADQEDSYFEPRRANVNQDADLFEHCARAMDISLKTGVHGLPLMGSGDWNDGMNRVGHAGRGESVWLAWFMQSIFPDMIALAEQRGMRERAAAWRSHSQSLKGAIETEGWDGEWYRRAFFDDGTPLGSAANSECRIDSIAQTWSVLSNSGDDQRSVIAMQAVEKHLIQRDSGLILLFTPPFDQTKHDPGYIKGYVPGVRENGGQYTHAAIWCVCAYAKMGNGTRAAELFSMLNPILRATTPEAVQTYKVEPYVMAADIYGVSPHIGRGGWTWYTGSAGWMYRAGLEYILGIEKRGNRLHVNPCIPDVWPGFSVTYRHGNAVYSIEVENPKRVCRGVAQIFVDRAEVSVDQGIELVDRVGPRSVRVILG